MREAICNECGNIFRIDEGSIETECIDFERKIEKQFFRCVYCGHQYPVMISDQPMRDMINQRRAIAIRIQALAGKKQIVKIKKLEKEDESLKEQILERGQQLKAEYEKGSFTE